MTPFRGDAHLDSGYFVNVARLLVYMWPPTSMCTGALDLVSWAGSLSALLNDWN